MRDNTKVVIKIIFMVMLVVGASMVLPGIVGLIYGEYYFAKVFLLCAFALVTLGMLASFLIPKTKITVLKNRDGFIVVAVSWLAMSIIGAMPFVISGDIPSFADAFFETASGFSTTGSSCLNDIEALSHASLMWRSFTHWLGGMGVLVLTIALLPKLGIGGQRLMRAETTGLTLDKTTYTFNESARVMYSLYVGITVAEFIALMLAGMNAFDSAIHTFGTVGTGGFSSYNNGISAFNSVTIEMLLAFFMLICGINFSNLSLMATGKFKKAFRDVELKTYLWIVVIAIVIITALLCVYGVYGLGDSLRYSVFQVSSIITTTGFGTADYEKWPEMCKSIIFALMFVGGCGGSTAGGMKVIRIVLLVKLVIRAAERKLHPNNVVPIRIGKQIISDEVAMDTCGYFGLYALVACVATFLLGFENVDFATSFSTAVTSLSNIGPGLNLIGPACNFSFYSPAAKIMLGLLMLAGRLELYTMFVVFKKE